MCAALLKLIPAAFLRNRVTHRVPAFFLRRTTQVFRYESPKFASYYRKSQNALASCPSAVQTTASTKMPFKEEVSKEFIGEDGTQHTTGEMKIDHADGALRYWDDGKPVREITREMKDALLRMKGVSLCAVDTENEALEICCNPNEFSENTFQEFREKFDRIKLRVILCTLQFQPAAQDPEKAWSLDVARANEEPEPLGSQEPDSA